MADVHEPEKVWRASLLEILPGPIDQVWEIFADFDGMTRQLPVLQAATCETVEGEQNQPGSLRLMKGPKSEGVPQTMINERLLTIDRKNHTMSYAMEKNTLGWSGYTSTIAMESFQNGQTQMKWSYEATPISTRTEDEFRKEVFDLYHLLLKDASGKFSSQVTTSS